MAVQNLRIRGSTYWWRKKVVVLGTYVPISLSLRTGSFNRACAIALHLGSFVESLRMAYGERGVAVDAATLKKVFVDAMRWQLDRILADQIGSIVPPDQHRFVNAAHGEHWRLLNRGVQWTAQEDERLRDAGWNTDARMAVADLWEQGRHENQISRTQIDAYLTRFEVAETSSNVDRMRRVIYGARAEACEEASRRLGKDPSDFSNWTADAIADNSPFAWEPEAPPSAPAPEPPPSPQPTAPVTEPLAQDAPTPDNIGLKRTKVRRKKPLLDATEDCIAAYTREKVWAANSIAQVRTALRMFDFVCGGEVAIEDITQEHVVAFKELCLALPNRWGRTSAEQAGGIAASLERAKLLPKGMLGLGQKTITKHVSWICSVLDHAAGETPATGHRPAL